MENPDHPPVRLQAIDGLRGIAVLAVIYQHMMAARLFSYVHDHSTFYPYLVAQCWMGVNLFFILSGFVLALPYFQERRQMRSRTDALDFLRHRAARLLPLFIFITFVGYALKAASGWRDITSLLLTLSSFSLFTTSEFFPSSNGVLWSLHLELWFGLLFPFLLFAIRRYGMGRVFILAAIAALAVRVIGSEFPFNNLNVNPIKDSILGRLDDFMTGILIAWLYCRNRLALLPRHAFWMGISLLVLSGIGWDLRIQNLLFPPLVALLNTLTQAGFFLVIAAAITGQGKISGLFRLYPLRLAGAMCFSIYVWHALLLGALVHGEPLDLRAQLLFWSSLAVLAAFTYRCIEFRREPDWRKIFLLSLR